MNIDDELIGSAEDDELNGYKGDDTLYGMAGNDTLDAGVGNDYLEGGFGDDTIVGGNGRDDIWDEHGNDSIAGGEGSDYITDDAGNDKYFYAPGDGFDYILDFQGDDEIIFATGINSQDVSLSYNVEMSCIEIRFFDENGERVEDVGIDWIADEETFDALETLRFSDNSVIDVFDKFRDIISSEEDDFVLGYVTADELNGLDGNDKILGLAGDDTIAGGSGDDHIYAGLGNDVLNGGLGNDSLFGMAGDDTYAYGLGDGFDFVIDAEGLDRIDFNSNVSYQSVVLNRNVNDNIIEIRFLNENDEVIEQAGIDILLDSDSNSTVELLGFSSGQIVDLREWVW